MLRSARVASFELQPRNLGHSFPPNPGHGIKSSRLPFALALADTVSPSAAQCTSFGARLSNWGKRGYCSLQLFLQKLGAFRQIGLAIVAKMALGTTDKFWCVILSINCAFHNFSPLSHFPTNFPADWTSSSLAHDENSRSTRSRCVLDTVAHRGYCSPQLFLQRRGRRYFAAMKNAHESRWPKTAPSMIVKPRRGNK